MPHSSAVLRPSCRLSPIAAGARRAMGADREQLTLLLRGLASRLDELDRRLADLAWRQQRARIGVGFDETLCERTALETERARLTDRLGTLAQRLNTLDSTMSAHPSVPWPASLVGICPYCGYPSLGSGLCAFCRPQLMQ